MKFVCALIVVENIERSRYLYERILGQSVKMDFGENVTFHGDFAIHQKDHFQKLLKGSVIQSKSNKSELYYEDNDLETLFKKIKVEKLELVHDIVVQPWRQKVIRFYDYDGNLIEVGEQMEFVAYRLSLEGLSVSEISRITYLPEDVVVDSIKNF